MSAHRCGQCEYDLSGLPATGTVVTCPECGLANNLAVPFTGRVSTYAPYLWATVPMAIAAVFEKLCDTPGTRHAGGLSGLFFILGVLAGALIAGVLMHETIGREPGMGYAPRRRWERAALSVCAAAAALVINAILATVLTAALFPRFRW